MFVRIRSEFKYYLKKKGHNSHVWKNKVRVPIFEKKKRYNSSVWKEKVTIPVFGRI